MFSLLRKTPFAYSSMKQGKWEKPLFLGNELSKKTIGIVGYGKIGQLVSKRLQGFEPNVLYYDRKCDKSLYGHDRCVSNIEEIFRLSDIVTIHLPLLPETKNLVCKKLLDLMPSHSILINASRGGIVCENDFINHMKSNKIRGAAFDVFETEPLPSNSPMRELENVILTPHLGASTKEAQFRVGEMAVHQIIEFFLNNTIINQVGV